MTPSPSGSPDHAPRARSIGAELAVCFDKPWVRCVLILLLGFAVRFPALQGQFLWDDGYLAQGNPFIKSPILALETFRHNLLLDSFSAHYRPIQTVSYIVDYLFWNTNPYGFHLSSVLWHVGSGVLLYFLLHELFRAPAQNWFRRASGATAKEDQRVGRLALLLALLWVVHPVHSAAVDYISGRADSLAFFFSCGGWLLYAHGRKHSAPVVRWLCYAAAAASQFLALCSRESAAMWVMLFLAYLFAADRKIALRAKFVVLAASLSVVVIYGVVRQHGTRGGVAVSMTGSPAAVRATLMLRALGDYGRLMVFPSNLHMERSLTDSRPISSNRGWRATVAAEYLSVLGAVLAAALVFGALRKGRAQNLRIAGAGWFVLAYLPISNLLELNANVAEHWLYLPSVGFLLFVAGCCLELPARGRRVALAVAYCAVLGLSARSFVRSTDWVDPETFYRRTFAAGGASVRVALNLSQIYATEKRYDKAEEICRKVLQLTPDYPIARTNLADILFQEGKLEESKQLFVATSKAAEQTRNEYPRTWIAAMQVARRINDDHDTAGAVALLDKARVDYPGVWDLISLEAEILRTSDRTQGALELVRDFAQRNWWHYSASLAEGRLLMELNQTSEAEAALWHASWLDVHEVEALNLLSLTRKRQSRMAEAYDIQRRAVARRPDEPRQHLMISQILTAMGRTDEAAAALAQVSRLASIAHAPVALPSP